MGGEIDASADNSGDGLGHSVAARAELPFNQVQVGGDECDGGGIGGQSLLKAEVSGGIAEVAGLQLAQPVVKPIVIIGAGGQPGDGVHDKVHAQMGRVTGGEVRRVYGSAGGVDDAAEILPGNGFGGETPGGAAGADAVGQRGGRMLRQVNRVVKIAVGAGTQRPEMIPRAVQFVAFRVSPGARRVVPVGHCGARTQQ